MVDNIKNGDRYEKNTHSYNNFDEKVIKDKSAAKRGNCRTKNYLADVIFNGVINNNDNPGNFENLFNEFNKGFKLKFLFYILNRV